jgi:hypothetical protein
VRLENCASAEQLVATLLIAWSEELNVPARVVVAPPPPSPAPVPEPEAPAKEPEPPVIAGPVKAPVEPIRAVIVGTSAREAPGDLKPALEKDPETILAERREWLVSSFRSNVMLLGGINSGPTDAVMFTGQLELSARLSHFGLLLDGGLETARVRNGPVPFQSTQQWLSVSALAVISPAERIDLQFAAGLRVWRMTGAANVPYVEETAFSAPGAVTSVGASIAIWGALRAHVRGYFSLRARVERFELVNYGQVMTLQPWQGGVLLGLDWRLL